MSSTDRIDGFIASVAIKAPCRMATTANVTLSGLQTIDGVVGADGDRVCVGEQDDAVENGIYVMRSTDWERASDFNGNRDIVDGTIFKVVEGTVNAEFYYSVGGTNPIIIGEDEITLTATFKPSTYYAQPIGETVWHSGNDGPGSGLNADLLDGQTGADYHNAALLTGVAPNAALLNGRPDTDFDDAQTLQTRNLAYVLDRANHTGAFNATLLNGQDSNYYLDGANMNNGPIPELWMPIEYGSVSSAGTKLGGRGTATVSNEAGDGQYKITHNYGNTNYIIMLTAQSNGLGKRIIDYFNKGNNDVGVTITDETGTGFDQAFEFILIKWPI